MNLEFQEITIRNFLSFGNVPQTLPLNDKSYQVIVGYNRDKSDSSSDRNGVGKSTIFEAIHYALFGKSIGNKVTLGNLVNNINKKNMIVTLKFKKDDISYEISRGRSPNILQLLKNGENVLSDESQGDSRETQKEIEKIIGMNEDIYNQIVCLSCKVPVFLDQSTSNQKAIIEKILGIDIISKKIESLKSLIKETKNEFNNEQFRVNTIKSQNENLITSINKQIEDMNLSKQQWFNNIKLQIANTEEQINQLNLIDIDKEIENFKLLENYIKQEGVNRQNQQLKESIEHNIKVNDITIKNYQLRICNSISIDFKTEKENHAFNESLKLEQTKYLSEEVEYNNNVKKLEAEKIKFNNISNLIKEKENLIDSVNPEICPTCGGVMNSEKYNIWKSNIVQEIDSLKQDLHKCDMEILELNHLTSLFAKKTFEFKPTKYSSMYETLQYEGEMNQLKELLQIEVKNKKDNEDMLSTISFVELGDKPVVHYSSMEEIMNHKALLESLKSNLKNLNDTLNTNPFEQQEKSIEDMKKNIMEVDESALKKLQDDMILQDTLLKLLNSPSSFVRKTIMDKSLEFLNSRIMEYLESLGSLHVIKFNNDMTIDISYMGIEYGYVSSGEMGRISIALILAFRDAWESLNNCSINLLAIDEVIDRIGLDTSGVELMVSELRRKDSKNVMLVTHNEVLINQASELLTLIKEHNFTTIEGK